MLLAGSSGSAGFWIFLLGLLARAVPGLAPWLAAVGLILAVLASLGGITVLVGGWIVQHRSRRLGAFLIGVGAGAGLLGFLVHVLIVWLAGANVVAWLAGFLLSAGGLGIVLALVAQGMARPPGSGKLVRRIRRAA